MNLINKDTTVYILNNTLMGLDVTGKLDFNNNFNNFANNLWSKGEVDSKGFFTLTSLTAKKNLRATSKTNFDLIEQGMLLVMMYNLSLKSKFFPLFSSLQIMIFHSTFGVLMPPNPKMFHCQIYLGQTIVILVSL